MRKTQFLLFHVSPNGCASLVCRRCLCWLGRLTQNCSVGETLSRANYGQTSLYAFFPAKFTPRWMTADTRDEDLDQCEGGEGPFTERRCLVRLYQWSMFYSATSGFCHSPAVLGLSSFSRFHCHHASTGMLLYSI